jgi:hypothetical protein
LLIRDSWRVLRFPDSLLIDPLEEKTMYQSNKLALVWYVKEGIMFCLHCGKNSRPRRVKKLQAAET